jgi:hypothetical protein
MEAEIFGIDRPRSETDIEGVILTLHCDLNSRLYESLPHFAYSFQIDASIASLTESLTDKTTNIGSSGIVRATRLHIF